MRARTQTTGRRLKGAGAFFLAAVAMCVARGGRLWAAQVAAPPKASAAVPANATAADPPKASDAVSPKATAAGASGSVANPVPEPGVVLDRLVAVVNGDVILESDVDEERRFEEVQPYRSGPTFTRDRIVERLIDRTLIQQQSALEPEGAVAEKDLDAQIAMLRKDIPACQQHHCETDAEWKKYLGDHGFTVEEFRARWKLRLLLLNFIEARFRNGITIKDSEIQAYYDKTMLQEYAKRSGAPP